MDYAIYTILKKDADIFNYKVREYYQPIDKLFSDRSKVSKRFKRINGDFSSRLEKVHPTEKFLTFVRSNKDLFTATVLFANPQRDRRYTALIWILGLENEYLPISVYEQAKNKLPFKHGSFERRIHEMEISFLNETGKRLLTAFKTEWSKHD